MLEKTLESPLDYKEIKPVNPKGNQSWIFTGRTDAELQPNSNNKVWPYHVLLPYKCQYCVLRATQVALVVKTMPANVGDTKDTGSIPGSGRYHGGGHGNPLQYSSLENSWTEEPGRLHTVCRVTKNWTRLKGLSTHALYAWACRWHIFFHFFRI